MPPKKSKPTKKPQPTKKWSLYPSLHNNVLDLIREHGLFFQFHDEDDDQNCISNYDTHIIGRFTCPNRSCSARVWTSKQVAVTIREYSNRRYNARVYYQSCKSCKTLVEPELDHSYAQRVAYRIKKWCGVQMDAPPFSGQSKGPHRSDLCEGCKQGHCSGLGLEP